MVGEGAVPSSDVPARHRLAAALVALVAFTGVGVASAVAVTTPADVRFRAWRVTPGDYVADPDLRVQLEMVELVNAVRAEHGMPPVQLDDRVSLAAQRHADYLASIRKLSHTGANGSDTGDRLHAAGFTWIAWGENVGAGLREPAVLVDTWLDSDAHRAQLIGEFRYAGVGVGVTPDQVPYWVLVLAS